MVSLSSAIAHRPAQWMDAMFAAPSNGTNKISDLVSAWLGRQDSQLYRRYVIDFVDARK